ncbi:MAG: hypothetical protein PHN74_01045 [Candidatus Pacebacteria bacterium]|nr:hypothetical protein [Candidatus Paceibacterota bacterium]
MLNFRLPKNDREYYWTSHSKSKMLQYRISEQKIKSILNNPSRKESGVAPKTLAVMVRNDKPKRKEEIWIMFQVVKTQIPKLKFQSKRRVIISVWRYPGVSKKREVPIPEDALAELDKLQNELKIQ